MAVFNNRQQFIEKRWGQRTNILEIYFISAICTPKFKINCV